MSIIGSGFALGIVFLICLVFFRNRYFLTRASRYYIVCLALTIVSGAMNIVKIWAVRAEFSTAWVHTVSTVNLLLTMVTTMSLTLYLIVKVIEHIYDDKLVFAKASLSVLLAAFFLLTIVNIFTGWMFTVNDAGVEEFGSHFFLPYAFIAAEIVLVLYYFLKHRKNLSKTIRLAVYESLLMMAFCVALKIVYRELSVAILAIAFIELGFFLNFQNHRTGVNTLTKLSDGRSFYNEIAKRIRVNEPFKAYLIKIKNLAAIKQNYGYRAGDEALYLFGFALDKLFDGGIPFHMHGATFALVLPFDEGESDVQTEQLLEFLEQEIKYEDYDLKFDCIVAENVYGGECDADLFYERLEYAVEFARLSSQRCIKCTDELDVARLRKKYLINRLETIDHESGYEIWFQPIFNVSLKKFASAEILLRLKESDGSFISPGEFIPIAETTGQIVPITWFVIEEACRALSENRELDKIRVSINLPMNILVDETFEDKLNGIVDSYGLPHERFSFEFTERVILDDLDIAEKNMKKLAESGYTFHLDDFGVGYSNFNCVLRLPLKTVKLDMTLTSTTEKNSDSSNIVNILTDLFHDMGLNVVAEGAESSEQVEILSTFGVDAIQGYFFAKPMPLDKLKEFLANKE